MPTSHDLFDTLLNQPPGRYGLSSYGQTTAVVLTGGEEFRRKGYNLFVSMGGEAAREVESSTPLPPIHRADDRPDGIFFCLPVVRIRLALALYFNAHLIRANTRDLLDEEGDFIEVVCDNESALWEEAQQLACDFVVNHMRPDSSALPTYVFDPFMPHEHAVGRLGAPHVGDDST